MKTGIELIEEERIRQKEKEGFSDKHDDKYFHCQLADAADCYVLSSQKKIVGLSPPENWPWNSIWWNPKTPIKDLIRAGALYQAEMDRIRRLKVKMPNAIRRIRKFRNKCAAEIDRLQNS